MPSDIIQSAYYSPPVAENKSDNKFLRRPMLIGCSGGGGHNSAIIGLYCFLKSLDPDAQFPIYNPVLPDGRSESNLREQIRRGAIIMHGYIGVPIKWILSNTSTYPILPTLQEIQTEITALAKSEPRVYIDMLLDVFDAGYESAAIWNILQKQDKVGELKKLIKNQEYSDKTNYQTVHSYFLTLLKKAAKEGKPYTEIVSTQAMALSALCEVVHYYNIWLLYKKIDAPKLVLHIYLSDLLTEGAIHFNNTLRKLSPLQQNQMRLYGVGISQELIQQIFGNHNFAAICNIPAKENPMVRPGFKDEAYNNSERFNDEVILNLQGIGSYPIQPNQKIAAIMLGSQAGNDSSRYISPLLEAGMDKVFIFGAANKQLKEALAQWIEDHPGEEDKIIPLPNQDDKAMASLMTRCERLVIRGGGLSVMEQMAMNHNLRQAVFIHHTTPTVGEELTSGISWEDANVQALIRYLKSIGILCQKTSPERIAQDLAKIALIFEENKHILAEYKGDTNKLIPNYFDLYSAAHFFPYSTPQPATRAPLKSSQRVISKSL